MNTSRTIALASLVAFATQVAFALLMLRLFTPQEVGEFSVISQIGFFWMTLALAQSNLSLLANQHVPAPMAARQAWRASALRGLALLPVAALAVWFSQLSMWPALLWALLLAFCQMAWMLAQSLTLRVGSAWQQALVRVLPPATAAVCALTAALLGASLNWDGPVLLVAALLGYAVGAAWLVRALRARRQKIIRACARARRPPRRGRPLPSTAALRAVGLPGSGDGGDAGGFRGPLAGGRPQPDGRRRVPGLCREVRRGGSAADRLHPLRAAGRREDDADACSE